MPSREVAWRVTAAELVRSTHEEKGAGERPVTYLVSPFGLRASRVLLAGRLSPAERIGAEDRPPFYRSRLVDPTGEISLTAGSYQPRALAAILRIHGETPVLVVGRPHLYRGRDQSAYVSVRAEGIAPLSEEEYRASVAEIVAQTLERGELGESVRSGTSPPAEAPALWVRAAELSREQFPSGSLADLLGVLRPAISFLQGEPRKSTAPSPARRSEPARSPPRIPTEAERAEESAFLDLLDELAEASIDGYADLREAFQRLADQGISSEKAEELLGRLESDGVVEEPIVGKLRRG